MLKTLSLLTVLTLGLVAEASPVFKNSATLKKIYYFDSLYRQPLKRQLKVAVFDKGFDGYKKEVGRSLPARTKYIAGPVTPPPEVKVDHGLRMAQILTDLATNGNYSAIGELRLYNVYGFSNFKAAIQDVVRDKVDLVLYSEVWEFGNNHDGRGFINREVYKAIKAGVLWINASGNFGRTTFNSEIRAGQDNWLALPDENQSVIVRCEDNRNKKCPVKVVLSWNDFKDDEDSGTDKDLDLALTDDLLGIIQASRLKQTSAKEAQAGESKYPREIVAAELKPGKYYIRVKQSSSNFTSKDRLRITVDGDSISMPRAQVGESLLNPADLPGVISVGAWDSDRTGLSVRMGKPEIWSLSSMILQDGTEYRGSSNSAAIVAAAVALMKAQNPSLSREQILDKISFTNRWNTKGLSLRDLGFSPRQGRCFNEAFPMNPPEHVQRMMARGAKLVETNYGYRLMTSYDPLILDRGLRRITPQDLILATSRGMKIQPRYSNTSTDEFEVFQYPLESGPCTLPLKTYRLLGF